MTNYNPGPGSSSTTNQISALTTALPPVIAPAPPTNVQAFAGINQVTVSWSQEILGYASGYSVTVGNKTVIATSSPITVYGVSATNAVSVASINASGISSTPTSANTVKPNSTFLSGLGSGRLFAWYSADQLVSHPANGSPLVSGSGGTGIFLNDASGNGWDITSASAPPNYLTSFANGKPGLTFNGTSMFLQPPFNTYQWNGAATLFIAANLAALSNGTNFDQNIISNNNPVGQPINTNQAFWLDTFGDGSTYAAVRSVGLQQILSTTHSTGTNITLGSAYVLTENLGAGSAGGFQYFNVQLSTGQLNALQKSLTPLYVGARPDGNRYYGGVIAEMIFFQGSLNATDRHAVEAYLGTKYNVAMTVA